MSNNGWPVVPLGEVVTHRKEFVQIDDLSTYKRCRVQLHAQGVVLRDEVEGAQIKTKSQQVCRTDEFLVAEIDAKMGGFGLVPPELDGAIVSSHYFLFTPNADRLDKSFLGYFCRTPAFREQVTSRGTTNYAAIRPNHVLGYTVPLPPREEQKRIVARIDRLLAKVREATAIRRRSEREAELLFGSFCHDLFSRRFRQNVETIPLGEIAEIRSGVTLGRDIDGPTLDLAYLRVANVQDGFLDLSSMKHVSIRLDERDKWALHTGDLLLTEGGDWDKLGRGTVWQSEIADCIHQNHIFRVRLNHEYDPYYVLSLTRSPYGKEYFQGASKQTTNLASINQRQLKEFPVFRLPLLEQKRVVAELSSLDAKIGILRKTLSRTSSELDAMLPSVLDRAFKGAL
jgi:type I restriction enzyme, S subunit